MAASSPPSEALSRPWRRSEGAGAVFGGDGVGELVEGALLGGEDHGFDVAEGDAVFAAAASCADVEEELFELAGDEHHVGAEGVDEFAGGVGVELDVAGFGGGGDPADGVVLVDAGQLDDAAPVAEGLADALVALLVLVVHLAEVGGDAEVVGDEEEEGLRVGRAEVGVDGGELFFFAAAAVEGFEVADEEDLEGRHERGGLGAVEDVEDAGVGEVEVVEGEVAGVGRGRGWRGRLCGSGRRGRSRRRGGRSRAHRDGEAISAR